MKKTLADSLFAGFVFLFGYGLLSAQETPGWRLAGVDMSIPVYFLKSVGNTSGQKLNDLDYALAADKNDSRFKLDKSRLLENPGHGSYITGAQLSLVFSKSYEKGRFMAQDVRLGFSYYNEKPNGVFYAYRGIYLPPGTPSGKEECLYYDHTISAFCIQASWLGNFRLSPNLALYSGLTVAEGLSRHFSLEMAHTLIDSNVVQSKDAAEVRVTLKNALFFSVPVGIKVNMSPRLNIFLEYQWLRTQVKTSTLGLNLFSWYRGVNAGVRFKLDSLKKQDKKPEERKE